MGTSELKNKAANGILWGGLSNGLQQVLNLVFGIFLARMLDPSDYGMVGMLSIFSLIASSLQESGFTAALINRKEIKTEDYNAVFWFSFLMSASLYAILFFLAPVIADFYNTPELTPLARYSFLAFVISSLAISPSAYLSKRLMIKQKSVVSVIALLCSGAVGIIMAYNGYAYWGITTQNIVYVAVHAIAFWGMMDWRPSLKINFKPIKEMLPFSIKLLIMSIVNIVSDNIFSVLLGKFYSKSDVGMFSQASKWKSMGTSIINGAVAGVTQPVLVESDTEHSRQLKVLRKMLRFTAFASFPAMLGLALIAPEFITITITEKWADSATYLRILCVSGAFLPILSLLSGLILSKGNSTICMWVNITRCMLQIAALISVYKFGLMVMITVNVVLDILWLFVWTYFAKREIGYGFGLMLKDLLPFAAIALATMAITYVVTMGIHNIYLLVTTRIAVAVVIYVIFMKIFNSVIYKESVEYLKGILKVVRINHDDGVEI